MGSSPPKAQQEPPKPVEQTIQVQKVDPPIPPIPVASNPNLPLQQQIDPNPEGEVSDEVDEAFEELIKSLDQLDKGLDEMLKEIDEQEVA